jgi:predicted RNase H-like nuclease (RuvC/YqgF family)
MKMNQQRIAALQNELREKNFRIQELESKINSKRTMGADVTPGGAEAFEKCCVFFAEKAE